MSRRLRTWLVGAAVAALLTAANASHGGYFAQSWGWIALAFAASVSLTLILGLATTPGWLRLAFAALMTAFGAWVALSVTWSLTPSGSMREVERMLVYIGLAGAVGLVVRRGDAIGLAAGACVGTVAVTGYGLATRLFPDWLESYDSPIVNYRLAEPIGYWNALGLLAVLGILLAFGFVAHARGLRSVAVAGASLPILATTLYFTFSRGAWAALAIGVVALVALDARRLRLIWTALVVVPVSVVGVAVASQQESLTTEDASAADAAGEGHRLALVLLGLVVASGALAVAARWVALRVPAPGWTRRAVDVALAGLALAAVVTAVALAGGPADAYAEIEHRFDASLAARPVTSTTVSSAPPGTVARRASGSPGTQAASGRSSATAPARSSTSGTRVARPTSTSATRTASTRRRSPSSAWSAWRSSVWRCSCLSSLPCGHAATASSRLRPPRTPPGPRMPAWTGTGRWSA